MNKKTIYLMGATIVILLLFVVYLVLQQQSPTPKTLIQTTPASSQNQYASGANSSSYGNSAAKSNTAPSQNADVSTSPLSAAQTAQEFYTSYYSAGSNPLANGAYKSNKYLSQDFKDDIGALYKNGNTPVFCPQNQRATVSVGQEQQFFYDNGYLTQVVISDAASNKSLYRVLLQNLTGSWQIVDINCIK